MYNTFMARINIKIVCSILTLFFHMHAAWDPFPLTHSTGIVSPFMYAPNHSSTPATTENHELYNSSLCTHSFLTSYPAPAPQYHLPNQPLPPYAAPHMHYIPVEYAYYPTTHDSTQTKDPLDALLEEINSTLPKVSDQDTMTCTEFPSNHSSIQTQTPLAQPPSGIQSPLPQVLDPPHTPNSQSSCSRNQHNQHKRFLRRKQPYPISSNTPTSSQLQINHESAPAPMATLCHTAPIAAGSPQQPEASTTTSERTQHPEISTPKSLARKVRDDSAKVVHALIECAHSPYQFCNIAKRLLQLPSSDTNHILNTLAHYGKNSLCKYERKHYITMWRLGIFLHNTSTPYDKNILTQLYQTHPPSQLTQTYIDVFIKGASLLQHLKAHPHPDLPIDFQDLPASLKTLRSKTQEIGRTSPEAHISSIIAGGLSVLKANIPLTIASLTPSSSTLLLCPTALRGSAIDAVCQGFEHTSLCADPHLLLFPDRHITHRKPSDVQLDSADLSAVLINCPGDSCTLFQEVPILLRQYKKNTYSAFTACLTSLSEQNPYISSKDLITLCNSVEESSGKHTDAIKGVYISFLYAHIVRDPMFCQHFNSLKHVPFLRFQWPIAYGLTIFSKLPDDKQSQFKSFLKLKLFREAAALIQNLESTTPIIKLLLNAWKNPLEIIQAFKHDEFPCSTLPSSLEYLSTVSDQIHITNGQVTLGEGFASLSSAVAAEQATLSHSPLKHIYKLARLHSISYTRASEILAHMHGIGKTPSSHMFFLAELTILNHNSRDRWDLKKYQCVKEHLFAVDKNNKTDNRWNQSFYEVYLREIIKITCLLQIWEKHSWEGHEKIDWEDLSEVFTYCAPSYKKKKRANIHTTKVLLSAIQNRLSKYNNHQIFPCLLLSYQQFSTLLERIMRQMKVAPPLRIAQEPHPLKF